MNYSIYRFTLDIHRTKSQVSIPVMFRDTGIKFYISLTDGGKPYFIEDGCRAVFSAKKHDGETLFNDCIIEDNTRIRYDFTEQTTNCEGMMNCEIRLYGTDGELITTPAFVVVVDHRVVYDSEVLDSYSEATTLDSIITTERSRVDAEITRVDSEAGRIAAENARVVAEDVRVNAENARVAAETERATEEKERDKAEEKRIANEAERVAAFASMLGMWVAYSAHADGTDYTYTWSEGQRYIGICNGKTQPTDKTGFVWAKFVDTGVYVGSGDMPSWCDLQIDPDGYVTEIVQTPGQSTSDMMSQKAVSDNFANALKGSASGAAVVLDDVSPIEHGMSVRVRSKNMIDPAKFVKASYHTTLDGDVFTSVFEVNTMYFNSHKMHPFKAGTYTALVVPVSNDMYFTFSIYSASETTKILFSDTIEKANEPFYFTFTAEEDFLVCLGGNRCNEGSNNEGDGTFSYKMQLEEGATATAYTPYVDISNVILRQYGKNLFPVESITTAENDAGEVALGIKKHGTYTLSCDVTKYADDTATNTRTTIMAVYADGTQDEVNSIYDTTNAQRDGASRHRSVTITTNAKKVLSSIRVLTLNYSDHAGRNAKAEKIQLEYSATETEYEPYREPATYPVGADGVESKAHIYPTTTLLTDTDNVLLDVTYNRDATKVVNELATRIAALESAALN